MSAIKGLQSNDQVKKLMQEMRALKQRSSMPTKSINPTESMEVGFSPISSKPSIEFGSVMKGALGQANEVMLEAAELKKSHDLGNPGVDLTRTLIASRKAEVAFSATVQVRNKLVDAYKDIMNMQI